MQLTGGGVGKYAVSVSWLRLLQLIHCLSRSPSEAPPHATREKSISYDQRSLTTLPTSGFRGLYEAHCEFVVYIDDRSWAGGFLRNFSFFAAIVSHVVTHDWLTNTW